MHHKAQLLVAVGVINGDQFSAHRHRNAQLLLQLAGDAGFDRFALLLFATGELPHPPQQAFLQALVNQHLPGRVEHNPHTDHLEGQGLGGFGHGPAARIAGSVGSAMGLPGAALAVRLAGGAKRGPKIHQGLVGVPWPNRIKQGLTPAPEQGVVTGRWARMGRQSRQHPFDVAIQDRQRCIKRTGKDAAGGGATDARQGHPALQRAGPGSVHQQLRRLMQPADPGVITEALPLQPHLIQRRRGQALDRGKRLHPTRPVGESHGQLGLLQHHLGDPDAVGIEILLRRWTCAARQLLPGDAAAAMPLPPSQQGCR